MTFYFLIIIVIIIILLFILFRKSIDTFSNYNKIPGSLVQISVSPNGKYIWGVDDANEIFCKDNINSEWEKIDGNLSNISVSDNEDIWGVNSSNNIFYRKGKLGTWQTIPGGLSKIAVSGDGTKIWGLIGNTIWYREGLNTGWQQINNNNLTFKEISVSYDGSGVCATDNEDKIYYWENSIWNSIPGKLFYVTYSPDKKNLWGLGDKVYRKDGLNGEWKVFPDITEPIKQLSVTNNSVWLISNSNSIYHININGNTDTNYKKLDGDCSGNNINTYTCDLPTCQGYCDNDPNCKGFSYNKQSQSCITKSKSCSNPISKPCSEFDWKPNLNIKKPFEKIFTAPIDFGSFKKGDSLNWNYPMPKDSKIQEACGQFCKAKGYQACSYRCDGCFGTVGLEPYKDDPCLSNGYGSTLIKKSPKKCPEGYYKIDSYGSKISKDKLICCSRTDFKAPNVENCIVGWGDPNSVKSRMCSPEGALPTGENRYFGIPNWSIPKCKEIINTNCPDEQYIFYKKPDSTIDESKDDIYTEPDNKYSLGDKLSIKCADGYQSVEQDKCLDVAKSILPKGLEMGRKELQVGNWGWVKPGCSVQSGGDWAAHFNTGPGSNNTQYQSVCQKIETPISQCLEDEFSFWAAKQGGFMKTWKKRWFVSNVSNRKISYAKSKDSKSKGVINVQNVSRTDPGKVMIKDVGGRVYLLKDIEEESIKKLEDCFNRQEITTNEQIYNEQEISNIEEGNWIDNHIVLEPKKNLGETDDPNKCYQLCKENNYQGCSYDCQGCFGGRGIKPYLDPECESRATTVSNLMPVEEEELQSTCGCQSIEEVKKKLGEIPDYLDPIRNFPSQTKFCIINPNTGLPFTDRKEDKNTCEKNDTCRFIKGSKEDIHLCVNKKETDLEQCKSPCNCILTPDQYNKEEDKHIGCFTIGKGSATRDILERDEIPKFFKNLPQDTHFCLKNPVTGQVLSPKDKEICEGSGTCVLKKIDSSTAVNNKEDIFVCLPKDIANKTDTDYQWKKNHTVQPPYHLLGKPDSKKMCEKLCLKNNTRACAYQCNGCWGGMDITPQTDKNSLDKCFQYAKMINPNLEYQSYTEDNNLNTNDSKNLNTNDSKNLNTNDSKNLNTNDSNNFNDEVQREEEDTILFPPSNTIKAETCPCPDKKKDDKITKCADFIGYQANGILMNLGV